ncbi:CPBP family intramembrane metalloprotease [Flavobacterium sp. MXW15]|uniref:CPBP family intramembrane metalloprotease n=1 Tax=Xanthomonas chitinilytica TaxID=2989819 RepID=A0ABT3JXG8_9XANT|nr:CPBP family intramembrane glutamic endopeptidase [Xanthomonas sp. H13-6]MCW4455344.1 CPBP family intramembrane metalloprotease [Flavobacterium sp. MXW15]MCW4473171.1 CPBP family intramembrane metalloprotease [Xanthomonas sp. H13-6]
MSVPPQAPAPLSSPPPFPPAASPPLKTASPVAGFWIDLGIGIVTLLGVSIVCGIVWGLYRGVMIGIEAAGSGAVDPADIATQMGQPGALAQILMALIATSSAALLLYFWRRRASAAERQASHRAARRPATWGWTLLIAAAVFTGSSLIGWLAKQGGVEPLPTNLPLMQQAISQYPVFLVVFAVLLAPAYEELLFRRVLFGRLWAAGRPLLGMVLSSAAFALVHEIPGSSGNGPLEILQLWLIYGGMGAAFAWLYQRTGTLWAPVAAHALNNAIALGALVLFGMS